MAKEYKKDYKNKIPNKEPSFQKILNFYLFECPVKGYSERGITFKELGWQKHKFSTLKANLLEGATPSLKKNYYPCKKDQLGDKFKIVESVKFADEYCVFLIHNDRKINSLFIAIRNAFAHGSFSVRSYNKTKIYFFSNFNKYLKAEIILQERTLLNWIKVVNPISYTKK